MELKSPVKNELAEVKMSVLACMETGNMARARTILRELKAVDPDASRSLKMDVVSAYGVVL